MRLIKIILVLMLLMGCYHKSDEVMKNEGIVSFVAVGDNIMHQKLIDLAKREDTYDFRPYYQHIKPYIEDADLSFINQETIIGGRNFGYSGYPLFNTPDEMIDALYETGFDIVNGSNNHFYDKGKEGVLHSIHQFQKYASMQYIGLYQSEEEKDQIPVMNKNGIRISFLSYNQYVNYMQETPTHLYNPFDKEQMKNDVNNAKKISDIVVVSCHWGNENETEENSFQKEYAQYLADLGVDVIIGTHTHTLQSVEWLTGKNGNQTLVAYSLGNFISGMLEEEAQLGAMLSCDFVKVNDKVEVKNVSVIPLVNHYETSDVQHIMETRSGFGVYAFKDYTENLASHHGLNGYHGIKISKERMIERVYQRVDSSIHIDM